MAARRMARPRLLRREWGTVRLVGGRMRKLVLLRIVAAPQANGARQMDLGLDSPLLTRAHGPVRLLPNGRIRRPRVVEQVRERVLGPDDAGELGQRVIATAAGP